MGRQGISGLAWALVAAGGLAGLVHPGYARAYDHPQRPWIGSGTAEPPAPADVASSDQTTFPNAPAPQDAGAAGSSTDVLNGDTPSSGPPASGAIDSANPTVSAGPAAPSGGPESSGPAPVPSPPATWAAPTAPASPSAPTPSSAPGATALDVSGRWLGTWTAPGEDGSRGGAVIADFVLAGSVGAGKLALHDTMAAESLPSSIRFAGGYGVPVVLTLSGSQLRVEHELGRDLAALVFEVHGDEMTGSFQRSRGPVRLVLARASASTASAAPPAWTHAAAPDAGAQAAALHSLPERAAGPSDSTREAQAKAAAQAPATAPEGERHPADLHLGRLQAVSSRVVTFAFNKADLNAAAQAVLAEVAAQIREHSDFLVDLEGYTDPVGTRDYNLQLSQRRATAVLRSLVEKGVELSRIHWVGLGVLSGPTAPDTDAKKRRVTITVLSAMPSGAQASADAPPIRPSL